MDSVIPLKGVVLFISFGSMVFIIVFCFIKRQITRFTLRSSHGPHAPIGMDAPKSLRAEIERKLRRVREISCEPVLLPSSVEDKLTRSIAENPCHYVFRMKAVDALALLDAELKRCGMSVPRKLGSPLKPYLLDARLNGRPLEGARLDLVEKFANAYEHARHDQSEFTEAHYQEFVSLLQQLLTHIRTKHALSRSVLAEEAEIQNAGSAGARMATSNKSGDQHSGLGAQFTSPSAGDSAATAFEMTFQPGASQQQQQQRIVNYALWSSGQCEKASGTQTKQL